MLSRRRCRPSPSLGDLQGRWWSVFYPEVPPGSSPRCHGCCVGVACADGGSVLPRVQLLNKWPHKAALAVIIMTLALVPDVVKVGAKIIQREKRKYWKSWSVSMQNRIIVVFSDLWSSGVWLFVCMQASDWRTNPFYLSTDTRLSICSCETDFSSVFFESWLGFPRSNTAFKEHRTSK